MTITQLHETTCSRWWSHPLPYLWPFTFNLPISTSKITVTWDPGVLCDASFLLQWLLPTHCLILISISFHPQLTRLRPAPQQTRMTRNALFYDLLIWSPSLFQAHLLKAARMVFSSEPTVTLYHPSNKSKLFNLAFKAFCQLDLLTSNIPSSSYKYFLSWSYLDKSLRPD